MRDLKKNNEIPNVPHLRFGVEKWTYISLGSISSKFDYGLNEEAIDYDGKHKYIRITDIDEITSKFINDNLTTPANFDNKYIVNKNDILLARTGASTGKSYLYDPNDGQLYFAGFLIRINVNYDINSIFVFNQLKTMRYKKWVKIISNRSGQPGINAEEYKTYKIGICSKATQDKIASFLSLIDKRLETQMKIIEEYKSLIQNIKNKIIENLIFVKWIKIKDICTITTGKLDANAMKENGKYKFFTCSKDDFYIDKYAFDGEALIISGNGELGLIKYYNGKFNAYQRTYVLQNFKLSPVYIKFMMEYYLPRKIYKEKNVGAMPYIVLSTIAELEIPVADNRIIEKMEQLYLLLNKRQNIDIIQLNHLKKQKQFLLNNMFI